jgi:uncharacterized protein
VTARLATTLPPESIRITTDSWTEPFWQAAKEHRLVAPHCRSCGAYRFPPTPFCPECRSQDTEFVDLAGPLSVFSFSVVRGLPGLPDLLLVPVVVEAADAPRVHVVSNLVDVQPEAVHIGMPVVADFVTIGDGWELPIFRVATQN